MPRFGDQDPPKKKYKVTEKFGGVPPKDFKGMIGVYEIHFAKPYKHAKHYMGFASDIARRVKKHRAGHGAALMTAVKKAMIDWDVVRVWPCASVTEAQQLEKKLKGRNTRYCPVCTEVAS